MLRLTKNQHRNIYSLFIFIEFRCIDSSNFYRILIAAMHFKNLIELMDLIHPAIKNLTMIVEF